jgi:predicted RecA/RadA family phage recombinase
MKNVIQEGNVIDVTPGAEVLSGAGFLLGSGATGILGVAVATIAANTLGAVRVSGVVELPKLSTDVVAVGAQLYWDDTNKRLTVTAGAHSKAGHAVEAVGNPSSTVKVLLNI